MKLLFPLDENTKVQDVMTAYPWLKDEAIKLDARFKLLDSPLAKMLIKRATIADASKRTGFPVETIIAEVTKMIEAHGA
ncbi:MAG: DUF1858 domain-containing protein [Clostridia bacterium]|nr:DUF1858 domain-containing protein [Clostridia bacterium]